ncbi:unnamed protein product [Rotaria sordida]|uniref:Uncharacterized protein n=1 Tax=Rotaria sordida TaxID=392033 RepID=A0A814FIA8_9BILA|nr:unnamed protein product [Rotaria sordida]CAF0983819.1 unnamed protein product [Rotaria sordida]
MELEKRKLSDDDKKDLIEKVQEILHVKEKQCSKENEKLEFKLKFAEQHQKNEYEFQKFCKDYEHSMYLLSKQNIHHYPTVIFGPCPFSNIKTKPRKTIQTHNKIELPLKFPWNGVSDTTIPSVIRKDPSIFFFFEVPSSEKN